VAWFVGFEDGVELVDEEARDRDLVPVVDVLRIVVGVSVVNVNVVVGRVVEVSVPVSVPVAVPVPESGNSVMLEEAARQISLTGECSICFIFGRG